jgi:hypothetical protein
MSGCFEKVYGDSHNLHTRGAQQRRQEDLRIAQENAKVRNTYVYAHTHTLYSHAS